MEFKRFPIPITINSNDKDLNMTYLYLLFHCTFELWSQGVPWLNSIHLFCLHVKHEGHSHFTSHISHHSHKHSVREGTGAFPCMWFQLKFHIINHSPFTIYYRHLTFHPTQFSIISNFGMTFYTILITLCAISNEIYE